MIDKQSIPLNTEAPQTATAVVGSAEQCEAVRALDWTRCVHISPTGEQCDAFIKITPSTQQLCPAHNPSNRARVSEDDQKKKYLDLVNSTRKMCYEMSYDELEAHLVDLNLELEALKAKLFTANAVKGEKLNAMDEKTRNARRQVKVVLSSPTKVTDAKKSASADEKATVLNQICREHKKTPAEATLIYDLMKKNKLTVKQAVMLMED
jgi:hypothetical protein